MSSPTIKITPISDFRDLPTCSPYLMPFQINYTGPASVSTYFHVKPAASLVGVPHNECIPDPNKNQEQAAARQMGVDSPPLTAEPKPEQFEDVPVNADTAATDDVTQAVAPVPSSGGRVLEAVTRFIASFRGRTVHGLTVELPEGYAGVVLKTDGNRNSYDNGNLKSKGDATNGSRAGGMAKLRGRLTRRSAKVEDEDVKSTKMSIDESSTPEDCIEAVKLLKPTSTFSSFVLWHPDIPVNEGKDEYFRSLTEWTQLAKHIHQSEE